MHTLFIILIGSIYVATLLDLAWAVPQKQFRKADLFLADDAIPGIEGIIPPEALMSRDSPSFGPVMNDEVLRRSYTDASMEIPALEQFRKRIASAGMKGGKNGNMEATEDGEDDTEGSPKRGKEILDPVVRIVLEKMENVTDNATSEGEVVAPKKETEITDVEIDPALLSGGIEAFVSQLGKCQRKLSLCAKTDIFNAKCYLHCLLGTHPIGRAVVGTMSSSIRSLCDPIGTIYDTNVPVFSKMATTVLSPSDFLTIFQVGPEFTKRFTRYAVKALPTLIIKYTGGIEAQLLKKTMNGLETSVKNVGGMGGVSQNMDRLMLNPACPKIHSMDAVQNLVNLFYQRPKAFDILLPGAWTVSKISQMTSVPFLQSLLQAFGGGLTIASGLNTGCGMLFKAEAGGEPECVPEEVITWESENPSELEETQVVCGSTPYFSVHLNDDTFPSIFAPVESTTLEAITTLVPPTTQMPNVGEEKKPEAKLTGRNNLLKYNWKSVDEILKAHIEYDENE